MPHRSALGALVQRLVVGVATTIFNERARLCGAINVDRVLDLNFFIHRAHTEGSALPGHCPPFRGTIFGNLVISMFSVG